ncbi:MAG TPA: NAD(P)/FAD-dependent oxidoreductase [Actinomycetota bacterium]|nr:NAD(P)/FAD-dependent oxidoreductase [Actinomycetota bacterium]
MKADVVVVGAGHNGLVAACYLASAGLKVNALERRSVLGGAAVTEDLIPGYRVSTASYSLSLLRPDIYADLELARHGLRFYPKDPQMFVPLRDGRHFFVWRDGRRTHEEISRINQRDADAYKEFGRFWDSAVDELRPFVESDSPLSPAAVEGELRRRGQGEIWDVCVAGSAASVVERFFESEEVQGAFASQGIIGTALSPRHPGTAWVMAYHFIGGELNESTGTWAYVRGGMGGVTQALAAAARERGVKIELDSEVEQILVDDNGVRGVQTGAGVIDCDIVVSNADPITTYRKLVPADRLTDDLIEKLDGWQTFGSVVKVNLALRELPDFKAMPGTNAGPQHFGTLEISPSVDYLHEAWEESAGGRPSTNPFMEVFIQSATDPTLSEEGHVLSAFSQYSPPSPERETWPQMRETAYENVVRTLASYAPNIPDAIIASDVLGPPELEERFALTGGNIFHGEITPDQSFGARFAYESPIKGLYLAGSGASPGGGVMGAAGRNCANVLLRNRRS